MGYQGSFAIGRTAAMRGHGFQLCIRCHDEYDRA
jgi:hypothetical protein